MRFSLSSPSIFLSLTPSFSPSLPLSLALTHDPSRTWLAPSVMETVNQKVVYRTRGLLEHLFGASFTFQQFTATPSYWVCFAARYLNTLFSLSLSQSLPDTHTLSLSKTERTFISFLMYTLASERIRGAMLGLGILPKQGEGPSEEIRERGFFNEYGTYLHTHSLSASCSPSFSLSLA